MSCVAVKITEDKIEFAADSIAVINSTNISKAVGARKLEKINDMIIGGSGYVSEIESLFVYAESHQPFDKSIRAMREFFYEFSTWKQSKGQKFDTDSDFIIAYKGKVFSLFGSALTEIKQYSAIGAGYQYALAALYLGHTAKEAVKVSCVLDCFVAEPIVNICMDK